METLDRWISRQLFRLRFGQFLERAAEWWAGFFFVLGGAILISKLLLPGTWPHTLWLGLGIVPVTLIAWRLSMRGKFTTLEAAAVLDSRLRTGGLLMSVVETRDADWRSRLPQDDFAWRGALSRVWPVRMARYVVFPLVFVAAALSVPLRKVQSEPTPPPIRQRVTAQLEEMLDLVEKANALDEKEKQKFEEEIRKLADDARSAPLTREKWETADSLRQKLQTRLDASAATLSKASSAAAALAKAAESNRKPSADQSEALEKDVLEALRKMAKEKPAPFSGAASNPKLQNDLKRLAKQNKLQLPKDPEEQKKLLNELKEYLDKEWDKVNEACKKCQGGKPGEAGQKPGEGVTFREGNDGSEQQQRQMAAGGVSKGGDPTDLSYGDESDVRKKKFKEVVLPPGFLDKPSNQVFKVTSAAPTDRPAESATRGEARQIDAATGRETWDRQRHPRHREMIKKWFETK